MRLVVFTPEGFKFTDKHKRTLESKFDIDVLISKDVSHLTRLLPEADILVTNATNFQESWLDVSPRLKWIHTMSAGVDNFLPILAGKDILLTNSRGVHSINITEHVLAMMLSFERKMVHAIHAQQKAEWSIDYYNKHIPGELYGKTVVIFGLGKIGARMAEVFKALGMNVLGVRKGDKKPNGVDRLYPISEMRDALGKADYVVVALPHTKETNKMFGEQEFEAMKPSAFFVNIGRGKIVDEKAMIAALRDKRIAGAGLDVFEVEPLPTSSPLWKMENVTMTPHNAGLTPHYMDRVIKIFTENLKVFLDNREDLPNIVDIARQY